MIEHLFRKFERLDRDVEVLSYILLGFIALLSARMALLVYEQKFEKLWDIFAPMTALVAALLVARVATRLITNNDIIREDDRRRDIVRVTHHLLIIVQDLLARINYVKVILGGGSRPMFVLGEIASTIERRYETLFERDPYLYLNGSSVDLINGMSGKVFEIIMLARGLEKVTANNPLALIDNAFPPDRAQQLTNLDSLMNDLNKLIDQIYELRASIDTPKTE